MVGDRETTAQVSEARVQPFPAVATPADLTVSYPLHGECHDHKTYVRGFASGADRLQKPQLFVDGQYVAGKIDADGSFEAHVQEPASAKGKPWSIRLEVATADGGRRMRTVPVDTCIEPPKKRIIGVSPPVEDVGAPYGAVVSPAKASTLEFAGAKIEIPAGAVDSDVRVTMRALDRAQVPPVQAETDNVTANGGALRFGPHGLKFKRAVKVTLPVDAARMPPGMTNGDVVTLFFDEASGKWTQLPKVSGRPDRTVGETTHFTDFIAATIKTPEHPDAQQFNPNTMKGVKAGEPGAGITMIQPPVANSSGSANLSYPIETPPARNGIGPSLALTYDSERVNANGWLGVGWDLKMSSIEIDTRFGVPKYDGTDIYSLDGAMLTPTTGGKYKKRVEGLVRSDRAQARIREHPGVGEVLLDGHGQERNRLHVRDRVDDLQESPREPAPGGAAGEHFHGAGGGNLPLVPGEGPGHVRQLHDDHVPARRRVDDGSVAERRRTSTGSTRR